MRRTPTALMIVMVLLLGARPAASQVFYQYPDAAVVKPGEALAGSYLALGDFQLYRLGVFGRMNATRYLDVGADFLFDSADGDGRWGMAADVKYAIFPETAAIPFDLAVTTGLGMISSDEIEIVQVPLGGLISSAYRLDNGRTLVPYLGVYVLYVDTTIKLGSVPDVSDTDVDVEIRMGLDYTLGESADLFVGVHLGRDAMVAVGATFWLKRSQGD